LVPCNRTPKAVKRRKPIAKREKRRAPAAWRLCLLLSAVLLFQAAASAAEPGAKRVIILHSFGNDFRPWGEYARTIRFQLTQQSRWPLDIQDHSLVTARSSDENLEVPFVEYLSAPYAKRPPHLIICVGAPAANFVQRHRSGDTSRLFIEGGRQGMAASPARSRGMSKGQRGWGVLGAMNEIGSGE
jgi:hypothetical protein